MLCPNCGKDNNTGTVFCINCGSKIPDAPSQSAGATYGEGHSQQSDQVYAVPPATSRAYVSSAPSVGEFTLMELAARIPILNIIMFCVWGFGGDTNESKRNWARSRLIWVGIGIVLWLIGTLLSVGMFSAILSSIPDLTEYMY